MSTVSVLTPTYNRANLLVKLFESLKAQTVKDFNWIIIDDGSTDNTKEIVKSFINENSIDVMYQYKNNGGKHTALNVGINMIDSPLTFIVDSDDYLTDNSIETIISKYEEHKNEDDICGYSFLRGKKSGGVLSDSGVKINGMKSTYVGCRINGEIGGDMAEVWYTEKLKEFPFPEFEGERFLGEDTVWIPMSGKYKMYFYNDIIYMSEYLEGGLTNNRRKHNIQSPRGCVERATVFLNSNCKLKIKAKNVIQYQVYGRFAKMSFSDLLKKCKYKIMFCVFYFPALYIYKKWKQKY